MNDQPIRPELIHDGDWCDEWAGAIGEGTITLEAHDKGDGHGDQAISLHLSFMGDNQGDWYHRDEVPNCPSCGAYLSIEYGWTDTDPWTWFLMGVAVHA